MLTIRSYSYLIDFMIKNNDPIEFLKNKCLENDLRITPQRTAIYQELMYASDHPSADVIYKRVIKKFPNISFDTVNRTLLSFAGMGLVRVVEGRGSPKRFDPDTESHHHFQCIKCSTIIDFRNKEYDKLEIPLDISKKLTVFNKKVILEGLCDKCRR
jgi:Fur family transcriptional regulator, peroxide stress response regulator